MSNFAKRLVGVVMAVVVTAFGTLLVWWAVTGLDLVPFPTPMKWISTPTWAEVHCPKCGAVSAHNRDETFYECSKCLTIVPIP